VLGLTPARAGTKRTPAITLVVAGRVVQVSLRLWEQLEGHELVADGYSCDGCSNSPDSWRGYKLWPACVIHDRHYDPDSPLGTGWEGRREADAILRRNIVRLVLAQGGSRTEAHRIAWLYWGRVRIWGQSAYFFDKTEQPESRWERFREVYGLFRDDRPNTGVQLGWPLRRELLRLEKSQADLGARYVEVPVASGAQK
jgi:hypothetical protein